MSECFSFGSDTIPTPAALVCGAPGKLERRMRPRLIAPDRWPLAALLLLAAVVLGTGLGLRDPAPPDEPRFALMARTMVETGDWLIPHRGAESYAHKPPVFMWLQAAGYAALGDLRIAFLLPSLLAALATLALVWDLARRLWGRRPAGWAFLILLTTVQFALQAKRAQIDAVLVAMTTASMYGLLRHHLLGAARAWALFGGVMAGLGTVTKGVGFLPLLVLPLLAYARRRGWRPAIAPMRGGVLLALAGFAAGAAIWLLPMLIAVFASDDPSLHAYAREILFKQTAQRYADPWHHHQPWWYFLRVIATLWLPFALALPGLLPAWWRRLKRQDARVLALVGWALLVLLFFSLSPGKREVYILPALPMLAVAAAPLAPRLARTHWLRAALAAFVLLLSLAVLAVGLSGVDAQPEWLSKVMQRRGLDAAPALMLWGAVAAGAVGLGALIVFGRHRLAAATLVFVCALALVYGLAFMPALNASSSARDLMAAAGRRIGPEAELGLLAWREQHLLQADRPATTFGFERPLAEQWRDAQRWLAQAPQRRWLFVQDDALPTCVDSAAAVEAGVANRRRYLLLRGNDVPSSCGVRASTP